MFPTTPAYSTSCVNQMLKNNELDVINIDLNINIWEELLSEKFIENCHYNEGNLTNSNVPFIEKISEGVFKERKKNVISNISHAKHVFRNIKLFNNADKLSWAVNIIFQAQQVIYYHYGTFIHNKVIFWPNIGFNTNYLSEVYKLSQDATHNPFIELYNKNIIEELITLNPSIIGIDIQFPWEIVQALTLNKLIKEKIPNVHINFIGHGFDEFCFSRIAKNFNANPNLMIGFDSVFLVRNDAELLKLYTAEKLDDHILKEIKSLAYINQDKTIYLNEPLYEPAYNDSVYPDYDELELGLYYSPEITFVDKLSSKCFWNKCTFCNINKFKLNRCEVNLDNYISRIKEYIDKYGCENLFLLDEAATPDLIRQFSQKILDNNLKIFWSIRTRVDDRFDCSLLQKMYDAGCREMWIGIEAISPNLLADMKKTDTPDEYATIVEKKMKLCNDIGIGIHSCFIFAFPTETKLDRKELFDFFAKNTHFMERMPFFTTFNVFNLNTDTYIYDNFSEFGVKEILYDVSNFNMINIPFIRKDTGTLQSEFEVEIDEFCDELTALFVKNDEYKLLWFTVADSSWELLMKKHSHKNIFQTEPKLLTRLLIKLYPKVEKSPVMMKIWNKVTNHKTSKVKGITYH